ncbi:MAG: hypothetical protein HY923_05120 [Elusimicrobia bacterium]|nr:hypothetical protein [Elusimicrobiota bacterium]
MTRGLCAVLLLAGCAGAPPAEMRVILEPPMYNVAMSSKLGLALTAVAEAPPGVKVRYLWRADAGFFLVQKESTGEILNLGRETKTDDVKILWSYDPSEAAALEKRPIAIHSIAENAKNSRSLARTDMTLFWDGEGVRAVH